MEQLMLSRRNTTLLIMTIGAALVLGYQALPRLVAAEKLAANDGPYSDDFKPGHEPLRELDVGTRVVQRFYAMLLSDKEPTAKDEGEIFYQKGFRTYLLHKAKEPSDTILCDFFRKEKELFLPKRPGRKRVAVNISELTSWAANLEGPKNVGQRGTGFV